jgi:membrane-bound lytic murein transglycosylase B
MRTRHAAIAAAAILALSACTTESPDSDAKATPSSSAPSELTDQEREEIGKEIGMPAEPTGDKRQELLDAIAEVNPDAVRYEDKAIDAARNQCFGINGNGKRLDWTASQRFTYKDVTTTEAQGKQINAALKRIGFCDV